MNRTEAGSNEYEKMDTLTLLRLYHKAGIRQDQIRDRDLHTHQKAEVEQASQDWDALTAQMDGAKAVLETRGAKFTSYGINLRGSSQEIQDIVRNNGPE